MHFIINKNNVIIICWQVRMHSYMYIVGSSSSKTSSFGHQSFLLGQPPPLRNPGSAPANGTQRTIFIAFTNEQKCLSCRTIQIAIIQHQNCYCRYVYGCADYSLHLQPLLWLIFHCGNSLIQWPTVSPSDQQSVASHQPWLQMLYPCYVSFEYSFNC